MIYILAATQVAFIAAIYYLIKKNKELKHSQEQAIKELQDNQLKAADVLLDLKKYNIACAGAFASIRQRLEAIETKPSIKCN